VAGLPSADDLPALCDRAYVLAAALAERRPSPRTATLGRLAGRVLEALTRAARAHERGSFGRALAEVGRARAALLLGDELGTIEATPAGFRPAQGRPALPEQRWFSHTAGRLARELVFVGDDIAERAERAADPNARVRAAVLADAAREVFGELATAPPLDDAMLERRLVSLVVCRLALEHGVAALEAAEIEHDRARAAHELAAAAALLAAADGLVDPPVIRIAAPLAGRGA
jgi:hypothetical protein